MRNLYLLLFLLFAFQFVASAQTFNGTWICLYATYDDQPNSTGYNTPDVGVIRENTFVALVRRGSNSTSYLVGYRDADSAIGRLGYYGYGSAVASYRQPWISGFDYIEMKEALDLATTPDSLIFVANNDVERNILVFKMSADSVISTDYRMLSGADSLYAIDVDAQQRVYVTQVIPNAPGKVLVFNSIANDPNWLNPPHNSQPMTSFTVPDAGELRGIAVNPEGTVIYVTNYQAKKVYCYIGSPTAGYQLYAPFNSVFNDTIHATTGDTLRPGPWGVTFLKNKNVLALSAAMNFSTGVSYEYGRVFMLNPNTGVYLDTIDCAQWNYAITGSFQTRGGGGTQGNLSGYASPYGLDWDNNDNMYTVSYYGWTVDKWDYSGTIPTIPLTISGVKRDESAVPTGFELSQNFPNPFNPSTTIRFSLINSGNVSLNVYNLNGELVTTLINDSYFEKGSYSVDLNASLLPSGAYLYRLTNGANTLTRKMTLIK